MGAGILCTDNCVMAAGIEKTGQDSAGGSKQTFDPVATGVSGLLTLFSGNREGDFHGDAERDRATFSSDNSVVGRGDVRWQVTSVLDPSLSNLVGTFWRVDSTAQHPAGRGGLRDARYTVRLSQLVVNY